MDHFEKTYLPIFRWRTFTRYLRFIDDIFFIWTGNKDHLITFLNNLNTKHNSINSEYQISKSSTLFLTRKFTSKTTHISTMENFKLYCSTFIQKGYKSALLDQHISAVEKLDRNEIVKEKVIEKPKQTCISLTLTYNRFCTNISKVIWKHSNFLNINESLKEIFDCQPITAFRQNKNLTELIGSNKIEKNKVKKRQLQKLKPGKCSPYLTNLRSLCCKQIQKKLVLKINKSKKYIWYSTTSTVPAATLYIW